MTARPKAPEKDLTDIAAETLRTFSLTHNYNDWVMNMLKPYIGSKVLEIGCGVGNLTLHLQRVAQVSCIDVSEQYLSHMRIDFPDVTFYHYDIADPGIGVLREQHFDTLVCVNVLEHVEQDEAAVQNMFTVLEPGGRLLVFVPALPCLYNRLDRNLAHFRRYAKPGLRDLLERNGFEIDRLSYSNLIGTFGWFLNGTVQRKRQLSAWQTILFDAFVPLVGGIERFVRPPLGMSLLAIVHKPASAAPPTERSRS